METKLFEIRDKMTFIPALAIRVSGEDGYLMRRAGFREPCIYLVHLTGERCAYDAYTWNDRTFCVAHQAIEQNWESLSSGDVIDVEYLLGESETKKQSEELEAL
jgi:hypothetical protein